MLENYQDTHLESFECGRPRPYIVWPDGATLGMGYAAHLTGDPGGFKSLGFSGYKEFYSLPMEKRNEFLKRCLQIFNEVFPDAQDTHELIKHPKDELEIKYSLLLSKLKHLAEEFR